MIGEAKPKSAKATKDGISATESDTIAAAPEVAVAKAAAAKTAAPSAKKTSKVDEAEGFDANSAAQKAASQRAAAAFVAARKKMAPAKAAAPSAGTVDDKSIEAVKGVVVPVADKKLKKTAVDETAEKVAPVQPAAVAPVHVPPAPVMRPMAAMAAAAGKGKPVATKGQGFKTHEFIVYPAHGVGQIIAVEQQEVAGYKLELFVISFVKDKMILKVPLPKIASVGMRKLAEPPVVKRALDTLTGRARVKRTMWSRRAQEYEAKINSGDLISIAEVVRDLYRSDAQPEQSYSERQLYEAALDRMARELSVVQKLTDTEALKLIDDQLQKGPRRGKAEENEDSEESEEADSGIGEAA